MPDWYTVGSWPSGGYQDRADTVESCRNTEVDLHLVFYRHLSLALSGLSGKGVRALVPTGKRTVKVRHGWSKGAQTGQRSDGSGVILGEQRGGAASRPLTRAAPGGRFMGGRRECHSGDGGGFGVGGIYRPRHLYGYLGGARLVGRKLPLTRPDLPLGGILAPATCCPI